MQLFEILIKSIFSSFTRVQSRFFQ